MHPLAVVLLTFNRPESAARVLKQIREARPAHLFYVSDAARDDRPRESELVDRTRDLADTVDWPCQVHRVFADRNMGCAQRVSSAVTEALTVVERVVVLEDDCVADPSFFPYCQNVLVRYANDLRVMSVTGDNFQRGIRRTDASYYFSKYPHCWGWATWRRAWNHFDLSISQWPTIRDAGYLSGFCQSDAELQYWTDIFDRVHQGKIDSWAYPWQLCCWMNHGLTVVPEVNLVSNIGYGERATHTRKRTPVIGLPTQSLGEIRHPETVVRHAIADAFTDQWVFSGIHQASGLKRLRRKLGIRRRVA